MPLTPAQAGCGDPRAWEKQCASQQRFDDAYEARCRAREKGPLASLDELEESDAENTDVEIT